MNTSPTTICSASSSDLPIILTIEQEIQRSPWTLTMFQDCLLNNSYHFWLIKKQELIGGFIVFQVYAHEGHIHNLGIKTLYQKQGLGGMLLQETLSFCQKQNAAKIFLEVRHSNQNAQKLYKKFGFKEIGIRKNYYSSNNNNHENAIVFQFNNEDRCVCGL